MDEVVGARGVQVVVSAIIAMVYVALFTRRYPGVPLFARMLSTRFRPAVWRYGRARKVGF
jgi:hypothetical protein